MLIHVPEDVRELPEREPPDPLPPIGHVTHRPDALLEGGFLRPQYARVAGYLSEPTIAPAWHADLPELDNPLPLTAVLRQPVLPAPRDWVEAMLPEALRARYGLTYADLDWQRINAVTLVMFGAVERALSLMLHGGPVRDDPDLDIRARLLAFAEATDDLWRAGSRQPLHLQWLCMALLRPRLEGPLDLVLMRWLRLSAHARGRPSREHIECWMQLVAHVADPGGGDHVIKTGDLPAVPAADLARALLETWDRLDTDRHAPKSWAAVVIAGTNAPNPWSAGFRLDGAKMIPLQMFGLGYCLQGEAWKRAEKGDVLLLQIGEAFGSHLAPADMGGLWQLWISPEDLAAGRFDAVEMTAEMT